MRIWLLLLPFSLVAAEALDFEMSVEEKKSTGVGKLTEKEKMSLHEWIVNHYSPRPEVVQLAQKNNGGRPTISEVLQNGRYLRLSDNTLWQINPPDQSIVQGWITPVAIIVAESSNPDYPFLLTNSLTGSSVSAQRAQTQPKPQHPMAPSTLPKTKTPNPAPQQSQPSTSSPGTTPIL